MKRAIKKLVVKTTGSTFILENVKVRTVKITFRGKRASVVNMTADEDGKIYKPYAILMPTPVENIPESGGVSMIVGDVADVRVQECSGFHWAVNYTFVCDWIKKVFDIHAKNDDADVRDFIERHKYVSLFIQSENKVAKEEIDKTYAEVTARKEIHDGFVEKQVKILIDWYKEELEKYEDVPESRSAFIDAYDKMIEKISKDD